LYRYAAALACENTTAASPSGRRLLRDEHAGATAGRKLLAGGASRGYAAAAYDPVMRLAVRLLSGGTAADDVGVEDTGAGDDASASARRRQLLKASGGGSTATGGSSGSSSSSPSPLNPVKEVMDWKGYELLRGGAASSQQFVPPASFVGRRYVSNTNKIVGGVLVHQIRNGPGECSNRFGHLTTGAMCRGLSNSKESFGTDPLFKPPVDGSTEESMYSGDLADHISSYYNTSQGSGDVKNTGAPYAFHHRNMPGMPDGFVAFLDIAASREQAANFLQYLQEGLFFDGSTRHIVTQVVTYNANLKQAGLYKFVCCFTSTTSVCVVLLVQRFSSTRCSMETE
jgi:hypothetical protein